jgi:LuxR family maltose regulon positive regulatory protein
MYRAALALVRGDALGTIRHADRAVDRAAVDDHLTRAGASALSGLAFWGNGDLEAAHRAYSVCVDGLHRVGHISDVLGCSITLADIRITQGRLTDAVRTYERALELASDHGGTALRGTADMYVGMSQIAVERNDLGAAAGYLRRSRELGEHGGLPQNSYRWRVSMAGLLHARGDRTGARQQALCADDDVSYLREFEHLTLARVLLSRYAIGRAPSAAADANRLLDRLLAAAEAGERTGSVIEILVLLALTRHARGDTPGAVVRLERALDLAEPEGYVRVFAGAAPPMISLLRTVAKRRASWSYVHRLVAACGDAGADHSGRRTRSLIDPLSERELQVLRLLGTDLDGPAIARELVVSLNTLRTHTRNIYTKLGVTSRRAAVHQAAAARPLTAASGHRR